MWDFDTLVHKIADRNPGKESMEKITDILDDMFDELKVSDNTLYEETMYKLAELAYHISQSQAESIVRSMKPYGQKWSYDVVKDYLKEKGITEDICKWYLVMNMCYNDYYNTAKLIGKQEEPDFYFSLARDFIMDVDAKPLKVEKYFIK